MKNGNILSLKLLTWSVQKPAQSILYTDFADYNDSICKVRVSHNRVH